MNALSLTTSESEIAKRLSRQIHGFPDEGIIQKREFWGFFGKQEIEYKTSIQNQLIFGRQAYHTAGELFERIRDPKNFPSSFNEAGELFGLKYEWWNRP